MLKVFNTSYPSFLLVISLEKVNKSYFILKVKMSCHTREGGGGR
jgi:hypothetical protein